MQEIESLVGGKQIASTSHLSNDEVFILVLKMNAPFSLHLCRSGRKKFFDR